MMLDELLEQLMNPASSEAIDFVDSVCLWLSGKLRFCIFKINVFKFSLVIKPKEKKS